MQDLIQSSGQFVTFLTLLGGGLLYLLVTGALGAIFGDHHDVGHGEHSAEHSADTVSIFSPRIIAIFATGFGAGGVLATYAGLGTIGATLWGIATGAAIGGVGLYGMRLLYAQQSNSEVSTASAVGRVATVSSPIPENGLGEVELIVGGQLMNYRARSAQAFGKGASVTISSVRGHEVLVG